MQLQLFPNDRLVGYLNLLLQDLIAQARIFLVHAF